MKKYEFDIGQSDIDLFFPHNRVKTKIQILEILLETTRFILTTKETTPKNVVGKIILFIDKMSRLFFFKEDKYYSIVFPFYVSEIDDIFNFSFKNGIEVDAQIISHTFSIISCNVFNDSCIIDFIEPINEIEENSNEDFWYFLKELLLYEDGYIRYDKDEVNYKKALENGEEDKHPLHHFDFFYTSNATLKIGLEKEMVNSEFINTLDINKDCKYLKN